MFDLQLEWTVGVGDGGREKKKQKTKKKKPLPHTHPSPYFWPSTAPLVQIYFSPQPSAAIKIKNGGHSIRYEITEHSLAKITPLLPATHEATCCAASRAPDLV